MAKIAVEKNSVLEKCLAKLYARNIALETWPKIFPNNDVQKIFAKNGKKISTYFLNYQFLELLS